MKTVLITGASRGIGLELARQCAARGDRVFAGARTPAAVPALDGATPVALDVTDAASITAAASTVTAAIDRLDLLINNAAINPEDPPYSTFGRLDAGAIAAVLQTNSIAPLIVTQAFTPLLDRGSAVINTSSEMASLADRDYGGSHAYCMSKAALNMATRGLAVDLRRQGVIVLALDPGWVRTDMGGPGATLSVEQSARGCLRVIDGLTLSDSGRFLNYAGHEHRW